MANKTQNQTFQFATIVDDSPMSSSVAIINEDCESVSIYSERPACDESHSSLSQDLANSLLITNGGNGPANRVGLALLGKDPKDRNVFCEAYKIPKVGAGLSYILAGDFRGTKLLDIAVTDALSNKVYILQNRGDGQKFETSFTCDVGDRPVGMAVGNFFRNGRVDIAVANAGSHDISLLRNDGNGGFEPRATISLDKNSSPYSIAAGDFLGNGLFDIAVASESEGRQTVTIFKNLNTDTGGFEPIANIGDAGRFVANFKSDSFELPDPPRVVIPVIAVINADFTAFALARIKGTNPPEFERIGGGVQCNPPDCLCTTLCHPGP